MKRAGRRKRPLERPSSIPVIELQEAPAGRQANEELKNGDWRGLAQLLRERWKPLLSMVSVIFLLSPYLLR